MYSYEDRKKAVELYIQYDLCCTKTIRTLGYPDGSTLKRWYKEFKKSGTVHERFVKHPKYTTEQMQLAVDYYLEHGRCISRTLKAVGYPARATFLKWLDELAPEERKPRIKRKNMVKCSQEQKQEAVIELCTRDGSAAEIANAVGTSRTSLYKWKRQLLDEENIKSMDKTSKESLSKNIDELQEKVKELDKEIYRKQMEIDVLNKAAEIVKKEKGIAPKNPSNREKTVLVDALRTKYKSNELLAFIKMPKSSYYYQKTAINSPDKYSQLREYIRDVFIKNKECYGYRRIHKEISKTGKTVSEKVVRKLMKEEQLFVPYNKKNKKYSSYLGEISPAVENIVARNFHADKPNMKWLTDITEFNIPAGKIYLSPIIDCFDGMVVSWTIGTSPNAELVNTMLDDAICCLEDSEHPIIHSDRGSHYRWPGWIDRMDKARLTRSMSKKGCSPDNSACEGFFGRLKNEMFYYRSWKDVSIDKFVDILQSYLIWYNEERIKMSLGGMSPIEYRQSLGLVA